MATAATTTTDAATATPSTQMVLDSGSSRTPRASTQTTSAVAYNARPRLAQRSTTPGATGSADGP